MPIFQARGKPGDIPTPPRATTKLLDATCTSPALGETGEDVRGLYPLRTPNSNRIVNLTLTPQTLRQTGAKPPAAWTLQELSCTTNRGRAVRESGTDVSLVTTARVKVLKS